MVCFFLKILWNLGNDVSHNVQNLLYIFNVIIVHSMCSSSLRRIEFNRSNLCAKKLRVLAQKDIRLQKKSPPYPVKVVFFDSNFG